MKTDAQNDPAVRISNRTDNSIEIGSVICSRYDPSGRMLQCEVLNSSAQTIGAGENGMLKLPAVRNGASYGKVFVTDSSFIPLAEALQINY